MSDEKQPQPPAARPFVMKPADLVQRQQFNILHYWSERIQAKATETGTGVPATTTRKPVVLPDRWAPLRGVELRTWQEDSREKWFKSGKRGKINWGKDRGKEPQRDKAECPWFWGWDEEKQDFAGGREFLGDRLNDCHDTNEFKTKARK